jgi:23S rRNA pseudouridine2604 synthase
MEEEKRSGTRLNKYLSEAGVCSRREADQAIEAGEVMIDGRTAVLGDRVQEGETVIFREEVVEHKEPEVLLLLNKPRGIVCTAEKKEKNNIVDYLNYPVRVYPVGRLDKDSRGLILLTNQGDLVNKLNRGGNFHEKEYVVKIDSEVTEDFLNQMQKGVYLTDLHVKTRPCKCWKTSYDTFHIVLTQGLNRQIRRMCEMLGKKVKDLCRIRIMNLKIADLEEGAYRQLTEEEKKDLIESLKDSYSDPLSGPRPKKSFGKKPYGKKPYERKSYGGSRSEGRSYSRSYGDRDNRRPYGDRSREDRPYGNRSYGEKSYGDRNESRRTYGDRDRSYGNKSYGDKSYAKKPYGDRSDNRRSYGDRDSRDSRPYGNRSYSDRPYNGRKSYQDRSESGENRRTGGNDRRGYQSGSYSSRTHHGDSYSNR